MKKEELTEILRIHGLWLSSIDGGRRADLSYANLRNADLSGADLSYANLRGADLSGADLSYANLRNADLRDAKLSGTDLSGAVLNYANLSGTDLRGANLRDANLSGTNLMGLIGNMNEISSIRIDMYSIVFTKDILQIGCKSYTYKQWLAFEDEEISKMDNGALEWWKKWKDFIFKAIELKGF